MPQVKFRRLRPLVLDDRNLGREFGKLWLCVKFICILLNSLNTLPQKAQFLLLCEGTFFFAEFEFHEKVDKPLEINILTVFDILS